MLFEMTHSCELVCSDNSCEYKKKKNLQSHNSGKMYFAVTLYFSSAGRKVCVCVCNLCRYEWLSVSWTVRSVRYQKSVQPSSSSEKRDTEQEREIRPEESDLRTVGGILDGNLNDERRQRKREGQARTQSYSLLSTQMPIPDTLTLGPGNFCFLFWRSHT